MPASTLRKRLCARSSHFLKFLDSELRRSLARSSHDHETVAALGARGDRNPSDLLSSIAGADLSAVR